MKNIGQPTGKSCKGLLEDGGVSIVNMAEHQLLPVGPPRLLLRLQEAVYLIVDVLHVVVRADDGDLVRDLGEEETDQHSVVSNCPIPAEDDDVPVAVIGHQGSQLGLDEREMILRLKTSHPPLRDLKHEKLPLTMQC